MKEIGKFDVKLGIIPNGLEKYTVFTTNRNLVFIHGMQFMNSSLDALINNLSHNDFKHIPEEFSNYLLKLVKQKGVYSYEYINNFEIFFEDKLPDKFNFFSSLKDQCISEKDYKRALDVCNVFTMNTVGDYHDLYLKTDVLLLADIFEKFVNTYLDYYGLDPCCYFNRPGLSWDAMLKMAGIELELISDIDMHLFIEKGMGGGIPFIDKRHGKANNKYMKCYDKGKESKYITYGDANNLYGYEMSQYLPYSEFKWVNQKEISGFCLNSINGNSSIGYILEVGLNDPDDLHELHNDYPLAPEKVEISQNMLSN